MNLSEGLAQPHCGKELVFNGYRVSFGGNENFWRWMVMKMIAQ